MALRLRAVRWARENPEKGSFVTDIKKRLSNINGKETLEDLTGRRREFTNREIVSAYLEFLIKTSKRYLGVDFKNAHVTLPVGASEKQRKAYEEILLSLGFSRVRNKLDEARAPLYHFFSRSVEKFWNGQKDENKRDHSGKSLSYLIIDCGGGTTDATLLRNIKLLTPTREGGGVVMETEDPQPAVNDNFGGTNLTDLLFDYLKMRICAAILPEEFRKIDPALNEDRDFLIDQVIPLENENIFWELYRKEDPGKEASSIAPDEIPAVQHQLAYGKFEKIARRLEELFPTDIRASEDLSSDVYKKVRANRNALWQLAERLKLNIFADDAPKERDLLDKSGDDAKIAFYLRENASAPLEKYKATNYSRELGFKTCELEKLFRPIIFKEISRIYRKLNIKDDLSGQASFFNVRFVGQTTNIPLFNEAISFFVPRSMIEEENREYKDKGTSRFQNLPAAEKKICCVTGAANFLSHIATGCLKNATLVSSSRVLKNFCRFGRGNQIISAGVYQASRENKGDGVIIPRGAPMSEAYGCVIRDLADDMTENFCSRDDENIRHEGSLEFHREDMSRELTEKEAEEIEKRWGELFHELNATPEDPGVLIEIRQMEEGTSMRYEFRPYYWSATAKSFMTTPEPLPLNISGQL